MKYSSRSTVILRAPHETRAVEVGCRAFIRFFFSFFFYQHLRFLCFSVYLTVFIYLCVRNIKTPWHTLSHTSLLIIKLLGHTEGLKFRREQTSWRNLLKFHSNSINIYVKYSRGQEGCTVRDKQRAFHLEKIKECDVLWIFLTHKMQTILLFVIFRSNTMSIMNLFSFALQLPETSYI